MEKIAYVTSCNIFEKIKAGGGACGEANLQALEQICGNENLYIVAITNENVAGNDHLIVISKHKNKIQFLLNNILNWSFCDYITEKRIVDYMTQKNIDIVFIESSIYGKIIKRLEKKGIKCIVYYQNIEVDYMRLMVKKEGIKYISQLFAASYNERLSAKYASYNIVMNKRECKRFVANYEKKPDYVIPMTYKDRFNESYMKSVEKKSDLFSLLFVGSSVLTANYDGIKWFIENVMTSLSRVQLVVVGKNFEKYKDELQRENVVVVGSVPDIDRYYYEADAVVCPIFYGSGMKTKTAEALMFGKRVLATDEALEGYELDDISGVFRCNTDDEFREAITYLITNEDNDENVEANERRKIFLEKYEENNRIRLISDVIDSIKKM